MLAIGYADSLPVGDAFDADPMFCRLGGVPAPVCAAAPPVPRPSCTVCQRLLVLIAQFGAPVDTVPRRVLYIFACNSTACMRDPGSWAVIRGQVTSAAVAVKAPDSAIAVSKSSLAEERPTQLVSPNTAKPSTDALRALLAQRNAASAAPVAPSRNPVSVSRPLQTPPKSDSSSFTAISLAFVDLPSTKVDSGADAHTSVLLKNYEASNAQNDSAPEQYEKQTHRYYRTHFKNFHRAVAQDPHQCIRYDLGGEPLFFTEDNLAKQLLAAPPACVECRGPSRFECQLMPKLMDVLPRSSKLNAAGPLATLTADSSQPERRLQALRELNVGFEFGTVLVYTCTRSCSNGGYYYREAAFVQRDALL